MGSGDCGASRVVREGRGLAGGLRMVRGEILMFFLNPSWSLNFLGNQYKLTYLQHIVRMNAIGLSPDCIFEGLEIYRGSIHICTYMGK